MRLLDTEDLVVRSFLIRRRGVVLPTPSYLIHGAMKRLRSKIWKTPSPAIKEKKGYKKVESFAAKAKSDGYHYVWVDTCWYVATLTASVLL